ncbi:hypothetical protein J437_LFUL018791 [Ladona fulva]|uniref:Uncharacterized protein n=1 Tax=Ladona fulva TaxID=123851 RepID=A0A8K0KSU8_LADFU|nr:hypothetical protein J437_LFUL018791 [Ladona fulva]
MGNKHIEEKISPITYTKHHQRNNSLVYVMGRKESRPSRTWLSGYAWVWAFRVDACGGEFGGNIALATVNILPFIQASSMLLKPLKKQVPLVDHVLLRCEFLGFLEWDADTYLSSGCTFTDLHYSYRLGISTISKIVKDVCKCIWSLYCECIPVPTKAQWESIAQNFERKANFPHCIGAVDGFSSVVLMVVGDSDYHFIYVDVGSYGKDCDSNIFKASSMGKSIVNKELEIPEEKCLSGTTGTKVPYFLVDIVKVYVELHNFICDRDGYETEDTLSIIGLHDIERARHARGGISANNVRNMMTDYFLTPNGSVNWQLSNI